MIRPDPAVKALRILIDEARHEPVRELRWERMDPTVRGLPALEPARPRARWPIAALALAAGFALVLAARHDDPKLSAPVATSALDLTQLPRAPGEQDALDLTALHKGDVVETGSDTLTFAWAGSVRWTLAPSSRARIRAAGQHGVGQVVALEAGSLHASVTPRPASENLVEAFAVEVVGTRVAVHGTSFRVTRRDDDVLVSVEQGAVAVGPVGHVGATTGHLLVAPRSAAFSLDGGRTARFVDTDETALPSASATSPEPRPTEPAPTIERTPRKTEPVLGHPTPTGAPREQVETAKPPASRLTVDAVQAILARCFDEAYARRETQVKLTVTTSLHLELRADGTIAAARFDPPLEPALQACSERMMTGAFSPGERSIRVAVSFER
jgi:hypothetical protein